MYTPLNDEDSVKKRMISDRLVVSGRAVIVLGIWSCLKAVIIMYLYMPEVVKQVVDEGDVGTTGYKVAMAFIMGAYSILVILCFLYHFYIGRTSMKVGYGKKKNTKVVYIIMAILLVIFSVSSSVRGFMREVDLITLASAVVDLTLIFACCDIIYSAIKLRTLDKKSKEGE